MSIWKETRPLMGTPSCTKNVGEARSVVCPFRLALSMRILGVVSRG